MKDTYLAKDFRATAARRFPAQAAVLNAAFDARLQALRADNAAAGKEKQFHLENQILPGIAAYETLQTVMPKEEALQTVHGYVEQRAWKLRKLFLALMRIPGLPRKTPGIFTKQTRRMFGEAAGFEAREIETTGGVWRIDMIKCPYHDACVHYGCPELCPCYNSSIGKTRIKMQTFRIIAKTLPMKMRLPSSFRRQSDSLSLRNLFALSSIRRCCMRPQFFFFSPLSTRGCAMI